MDFVPFTLLFMVSLLSFQLSVGKPAITRESNIWPENCTGKAICEVRPDDYPPLDKLIQLFNIYKDKAPKLNQTSDRSGSDCSPFFDYTVEEYYMIIDENKEIRYALYIPGHYSFPLNIVRCNPNTPEKYELKLTNRRCETGYTDRSFFVLTHDLEGLETVKSATEIPSSCTAVPYEDY
ncbi:uncharacterized protein LOC134664792 [Cydia fagiglandana]|uniref:uncharacterized protein LOC134664792 n=1 Tax=Cydia fagiglandana TaxID=1458189 RepID=UPI002FEE24CA